MGDFGKSLFLGLFHTSEGQILAFFLDFRQKSILTLPLKGQKIRISQLAHSDLEIQGILLKTKNWTCWSTRSEETLTKELHLGSDPSRNIYVPIYRVNYSSMKKLFTVLKKSPRNIVC